MPRRLTGFALWLFVATWATTALAGEHYVRQGATGSGSGADWSNAFSALPDSLVRGDTYYVASGSYPGHVFGDALSDSTTIVIKKATPSDHGTETGWQADFAAGPAEFDPVSFTRGHYEIDGRTGGGSGSWDAGYGIRIRIETNSGSKLVRINESLSHLTFRHVDLSYDYNERFTFRAGGPPVATGQDAIYSLHDASHVTFSHCRFNRAGRTALLTRSTWRDVVIEHTYFRDNTIGTGPQHGEIWSANHDEGHLTDITVRYNLIQNFSSTGGLILAGGDRIYIYGNIWINSLGKANGAVSNWTAGARTTNVYIHNNTFVGMDATFGFGNSGKFIVTNNLFFGNYRVRLPSGHDYNHADIALDEPNGQTSAADPFVDRQNNDFRLIAPTQPGQDLSALFTRDMNDTAMGGGGTWDRGALQHVEGSDQPPAAPTNLRIGQ